MIFRSAKDSVNAIRKYDDMLYDSRPTKFGDFISNKYNVVHKELYEDALKNYIESYIADVIDSKFLFQLFEALANSTTIAGIWDLINESDNYKHILESISKLEVIGKDFINELVVMIINMIDEFKVGIRENDPEKILAIFDIFDFILAFKNGMYLLEEAGTNGPEWKYIDGQFIGSEFESDSNEEYDISNDFLILLFEDERGIRIGYTNSGKWYLEIPDDIDITSIKNQLNKLVKQTNRGMTYKLRKYAESLYTKGHRFLEIKNSEYWQPSSIIIIGNNRPYSKHSVFLGPYWNYNQSKEELDIKNVKIKNNPINDAEITYLDYINGIAYMRSRLTGEEFKIGFEYLNEDTEVSDELSLRDTFTYKLQNGNN